MVKWELETLHKYYADGNDQVLRLDHYDGLLDGIIMEFGACDGIFTEKLVKQFPHCNIITFEPIPALYEQAATRLKDYSQVKVLPYGVSIDGQFVHMRSDGAASILDDDGDVTAITVSIDEVLTGLLVDLLIINIEGAEYDIMDKLLDLGLQSQIKFFQIQFHDYQEDAYERMSSIQNRLAETHDLEYQYLFVFESWKRR